jgi:hypothetical protein
VAGPTRRLERIFVLILAALIVAHPLTAVASEALGKEDRAAIRRVIEAQIEALRRDDADEAFTYAAPAVRELFGTPERFFEMVKNIYAPLYRPRSVTFLELERIAGEHTQKVLVVGSDGAPRLAMYLMARQPDGSWKILGCVLRPFPLEVV